MNNKDTKKETPVKDIEVPSMDSEIDSWCEVPEEGPDTKSADDLAIDAWCRGSRTNNKDNERPKK
jgi:hypothetical protein